MSLRGDVVISLRLLSRLVIQSEEVPSNRLDRCDLFDIAAPAAVVEAAGGSATNWHGDPLTLQSEDCALFLGDPTLLQPVLDLLHD